MFPPDPRPPAAAKDKSLPLSFSSFGKRRIYSSSTRSHGATVEGHAMATRFAGLQLIVEHAVIHLPEHLGGDPEGPNQEPDPTQDKRDHHEAIQ